METNKKIFNTFFEDSNENVHFFYNNKENVLGFHYPDFYIINDKNYKYIRIANIILSDSIYSMSNNDMICIDESFIVNLNGYKESNTTNYSAKINIVGYVNSDGELKKDTFKCVYTPEFDDMSMLDMYLTEETTIVDDYSYKSIGVWVKVENADIIFITKNITKSIDSVPMSNNYIHSGYTIDFLTDDKKIANTNTSNLDSYVTSLSFCKGINKHKELLDRINTLESKDDFNLNIANIEYDNGFVPITTGSDSMQPQIITPVTVNYTQGFEPFISIKAADKYFTVKKFGVYLIQLNTKLISEETCKVKISVSVNNTDESEIIYDTKGDVSIYSAPLKVLLLSPSDIVRVKMLFTDTAKDITNENTNITLIRLM